MSTHYLTKTETEIMQYIWKLNREVTAGEIRSYFYPDKKWSKQAVSTFLKQLVKYKYLNIRKVSATKYYYSVNISEKEYNLLPAKDIIEKSFAGSYSDFVCALIAPNEKISEETLNIIKNIFKNYENNTD